MTQYNFEAIGTRWQIDIYQELNKEKEDALFDAIKKRIGVFDKTYSRFRPDSLVTEMSKKAGTYILPPDAEPLFALYHDLYKRTEGLVTPLIGNIISDAGYDAQYSLTQKKELESAPAWDEIIEYKNQNLIIKKPVILDFGAAGKGYLVDLVGKVLESEGIREYCIDAGGDILYKNKTPLRVGLENPEDIQQVIGVYTLEKGSVCGSAGNRRAWGDFTHVINPKTLTSPKDILAVWVAAKTAMTADALATCLFFVPADSLSPAYDFEYALVRSDHSIEKSPGFSAEIFTA